MTLTARNSCCSTALTTTAPTRAASGSGTAATGSPRKAGQLPGAGLVAAQVLPEPRQEFALGRPPGCYLVRVQFRGPASGGGGQPRLARGGQQPHPRDRLARGRAAGKGAIAAQQQAVARA